MNDICLKLQHLKHEAANMAKKIELLEISKRFKSYLIYIDISLSSELENPFWILNLEWLRKLLGEGLGSCSLEELQQIEQQLERSVSSIRARKVE